MTLPEKEGGAWERLENLESERLGFESISCDLE